MKNTPDLPYNLTAMYEAIIKCDVNIKTFRQAIAKEKETKKDYEAIIQYLKKKAEARAAQ